MRLLYLYFVHKGKSHPLSCQDLNFDSEFRFEMTDDRLVCRQGIKLPEKFFSNASCVESVSAIVGANGAGKTAVARALSSIFLGGADISHWCIVAICDGKCICATTMSIREISGFSCKIVHCIPQDWRLVYLSNHFSEKIQVEADGRKVLDYSTTGLIYSQSAHRLGWGSVVDKVRYGGINLYTSEQYIRMVRFLAMLGKKKLYKELKENTGIAFPTRLKITINQDLLEANYDLFCERFQEAERERDDNMRTAERFLRGDRSLSLFTGAFINVVGEFLRTNGMDRDYVQDDDLARMLLYMADGLFCVEDEGEYMVGRYPKWNLYQIYEQPLEKSDVTEDGIKAKILSYMRGLVKSGIELSHAGIYRFLETLNKFCEEYGTQLDVATVDLKDSRAVGLLVNLLDSIPQFREVECPISFEIEPGMSSGELAYLILWSRLYDAIEKETDSHANAVFFFDEAETTLHPDWQRRLISNIIWMFEKLAPANSSHLIMASHSPILLSDIPKGNVLFLLDSKSPERRMRQLEELKGLKNTFGANIYDLLRLSFFLDAGPTGMFAQNKIGEALKSVASTAEKSVSDHKTAMLPPEQEQILKLVGDENLLKYLADLRDAKLI